MHFLALLQTAPDLNTVIALIGLVLTLLGVAVSAGVLVQKLNSTETRTAEKFQGMRELLDQLRDQVGEKFEDLKEQRKEDIDHFNSEIKRLERLQEAEHERLRQTIGILRSKIEELVSEKGGRR